MYKVGRSYNLAGRLVNDQHEEKHVGDALTIFNVHLGLDNRT